MKTVNIGIQNLCTPCGCACKYCSLKSCKEADGIDYLRGKRLAERFVEWGKEQKLDPLPAYVIGYCAEYPELYDNIAFNKSIGNIMGSFLQCNGIYIRSEVETDEFISKIKGAGIERIDVTFFGDEAYHDGFAAREGDYQFMLQFAKSAVKQGIVCAPSIAISEENKEMIDDLLNVLVKITPLNNIGIGLPDYRGRGYLLEEARLTEDSYEALSQQVKSKQNMTHYKTEKDWLAMGELPEYTMRSLIINLRRDNIEMFEQMTCDEIVAYVEKLDDDYYSTIPTINELAKQYGDTENTKLYRLRDLFWMWQKRYIKEHNTVIHDITDDTLCSTVRK